MHAPQAHTKTPNLTRLLAYVADLEVEVDRLRRHNRHVHEAVRQVLSDLGQRCTEVEPEDATEVVEETRQTIEQTIAMLRDLQDLPGYHPAHDQVIAVAVRPLAEQIFRWHQWQSAARDVAFRLELESEYVEWFPGRLRNILDNLISNAFKYRDPTKV